MIRFAILFIFNILHAFTHFKLTPSMCTVLAAYKTLPNAIQSGNKKIYGTKNLKLLVFVVVVVADDALTELSIAWFFLLFFANNNRMCPH